MKKRILSSLLSVCMIVSLCSISGAVDEIQKEFIIDNDIDEQKAQLIINNIIVSNGETEIGISLASIFCIFGHDMSESIVWEIMHRYYSTAPKCHQNTYKVVYCKRSSCNYMAYTLISSIRINCCA